MVVATVASKNGSTLHKKFNSADVTDSYKLCMLILNEIVWIKQNSIYIRLYCNEGLIRKTYSHLNSESDLMGFQNIFYS